MTPRSIALACVLPLAAIAAVAPTESPPPQRSSTVCSCSDLIALINRLNSAQAAVEVLQQEIAKIEAAQRAAGGRDFLMDERNPATNKSNYDQIKATIIEAMGSVQMLGVKMSSAETDADCEPTIKQSGSPCLDEVAMAHEKDVHVHACSTEHKAGTFTILGKRPVQTAVAYAKEEIQGYEREIAKIREILAGLPPECQSGWVGYVYFFEQKSLGINVTLPATRTRISGTETTQSDFTRKAKILFRSNGAPLMNLEAGLIAEMGSSSAAKTYCGGGIGGSVGPEHTINTASKMKSEIAGNREGDGDVTFTFDPTSGNFSLGLRVPDTQGNGTATSSLTLSGSCNPNDDGTKSGSASTGEVFAAASAVVDGTASPTAREIRGERTFDWGPRVSVPNVTQSHTARVTWILYRIEP